MEFARLGAGPSPFGGTAGDAKNVQTQMGPDLEEIQTEVSYKRERLKHTLTDDCQAIGFQAIAGEAKLRLLPSSWPADSLPPPSASLLSIASSKGLLAAAGPESVIIAGTDSVRKAFLASADDNVTPFTPQLTLPIGMRVSQVAFSADENYLVLSAEQGGGLAVYEIQSLMQGNNQPTFQIATNGTALRALVPSPTPEKAELFAVVTTSGQLMMANLKTREFFIGPEGQVLKDGVSCVSWSTRGKQLVAGLADGTCYQMTPEGEGKGMLARPPGLKGDQHGKQFAPTLCAISLTIAVSSLFWLENNVFLVAHTPAIGEDGTPPATTYHIVTRPIKYQNDMVFQKLPELCPPFGLNRYPPFQFMQRLKGFPPSLQDAIIVASTASVDIGLITRSEVPLSKEFLEEKVSSVFTTTIMADDSRRAQMAMGENMPDTSPIGTALDLSSKDKVPRPLPKEEHDESPGPLPAIMVLNNEGILSGWWIVYTESIRQGTTYPGLIVAGGAQLKQQPPSDRQASPFASTKAPVASPFGQTTFGRPSTPAATFGGSFSQPSASTAFGAPLPFGKQASPWGGAATPATTQGGGTTFGQPAFGSSTPMGSTSQGPSFGSTGGLGNRPSLWGTPASGTAAATGSAFGQPSLSGGNKIPFGPTSGNAFGANTATSGAPFASFASPSSGFMSAKPAAGAENPFSKATPAASFGSGMDTDTSFGATPKKDAEAPKSLFGGESGFKLGSNFKSDGTAANDEPKPTSSAVGSMFGDGFGDALGAAQKGAATPQTKDADMDEDDITPNEPVQPPSAPQESTTPATKPAPPKFLFPQPSMPPSTGGLFGTQSQSKTTPAAVQNSQPTSFGFGKPSGMPAPISTTPKTTPKKPDAAPRPSIETSPRIKEEPHSDEDDISPLNETEAAPPPGYDTADTPPGSKTPEAPLPPESTSKTSFAPGDSSNSSKSSDDAPLPPDFLPSKKPSKLKEVDPAPNEQTALPLGDEDEGTEGTDADAEGSDEDDEDSYGEGEVADEEGSGVDVAQEASPSTDPNQSPKITPESSFGGPLDKSPPGGLFARVTRPHDGKAKSLFGEVGKTSVPSLPPPNRTKLSPRSPSPIRASLLGDTLRPDNARSVSAPGPFQALNNRKQALAQISVPSKPQPSVEQLRQQERARLDNLQAKRIAEEEQDLSDRDDEKIREELDTEVEGTKNLDPFLAHQDYVGDIKKPGIPGQIEKVYRDINSMIDTLGLNARSLKAFVKGHEEMHKIGGRQIDDLEKSDWCLIEIGDLVRIEGDLARQLERGQSRDARHNLSDLHDLHKRLKALRTKSNDISRAIDTRCNPQEIEAARAAPLRLDQATQQHEFRKKLTHFQKQLAEVEENITLLRTKLPARESDNGKGPSQKKPTVEAITNTIMKMTAIAEKKRGDLDVVEAQLRHLGILSSAVSRGSREGSLEAQMRNLRFGSVGGQGSREGSPFTPGASRRKQGSRLGGNALQNGHSQSPEPSRSVRRSPGKKIADLAPEEVELYREKARKKEEVNRVIKEAFMKTGPRIRPLE